MILGSDLLNFYSFIFLMFFFSSFVTRWLFNAILITFKEKAKLAVSQIGRLRHIIRNGNYDLFPAKE